MPMQVVIIAIGTEMTQGYGLDTNGPWLARELGKIGVVVHSKMTISDDRSDLHDAMLGHWREGRSIITIGGLGPTEDDRTRDVIAALLGEKLQKSVRARKSLSQRYGVAKLSRDAKRQTKLPESAYLLPNEVGVAPGFFVDSETHFLAALPGPPKEMKATVEDGLLPVLERFYGITQQFQSRELSAFGISEPAANRLLADLLEEDGTIRASILAGGGKILLRWQPLDQRGVKEAKSRHSEAMRRLAEKVVLTKASKGDCHPVAERTVQLLLENNAKVAFAESCTGGLAAHMLTEVPGASSVFELGVVSYSNAIKQKQLGVSAETLQSQGAVSAQCVEEMAKGVLKKSGADIAVSISGIAGPDGGSADKPVGMVCFGLRTKLFGKVHRREYCARLRGDRQRIQLYAALVALDLVRRTLEFEALPKKRDIPYHFKAAPPRA